MKLSSNKERFRKWLLENNDNFEKTNNGVITPPSWEFSLEEQENAWDELLDIVLDKKTLSSYIELKKYQAKVPVLLYTLFMGQKFVEATIKMSERFEDGKSERANKKWTKEEDEELIERICNDEWTLNHIALTMGRTQGALKTRISYLVGIKRLSQKVVGKFIGEINGEQTEAELSGTIYKR